MTLAIGGMTRNELMKRITIDELNDWYAYFEMEPRGDERNDWNAGMIASVIINSIKSIFTKNTNPITPNDCRLKFTKETEKKQSAKEMMEIFKAIERRNKNA